MTEEEEEEEEELGILVVGLLRKLDMNVFRKKSLTDLSIMSWRALLLLTQECGLNWRELVMDEDRVEEDQLLMREHSDF